MTVCFTLLYFYFINIAEDRTQVGMPIRIDDTVQSFILTCLIS
jgi:hypothetical protein